MRTGACTVQQTLTSEAASVLKSSVSLARGRGHAQVTPLHVAATLLSSRAGLLRRACLKSHPHSLSHPLQSRALELCFNVALNRLPTIPSPLLHSQPSLSNALIAALKRAQAHQRRGCIEQQQQQQPLLAIKVELEQLIISILDDPSVSRVMREAGFSSTSVKNNLEDVPPPTMFYTHDFDSGSWPSSLLFHTPKKQSSAAETGTTDDLSLVVEVLLRKNRRNAVLVGDNSSVSERLVSRLMEKMERGEVGQELKQVHFVKFTLSSFSLSFMKREDVEMKVADLRRKVSSLVSSTGGAIIYTGDLKWAVEDQGNVMKYSPVDHIVAEIGTLVSDFGCFGSKVWLIGVASYQTYMRCLSRSPSLDTQWSLHAVQVPVGGLELSLHSPSGGDCRTVYSFSSSKTLDSTFIINNENVEEEECKLSCCRECTVNFEKEVGVFMSSKLRSLPFNHSKSASHLPHWMNPIKTEKCHSDILLELRRKWNRLCQSIHHPNRQNGSTILSQKQSNPSFYPWWSSLMRSNQSANSNNSSSTESAPKLGVNTSLFGELRKSSYSSNGGDSPDGIDQKEAKITLQLGSSPVSECTAISEPNQENVVNEGLLEALHENIPWQSEKVPILLAALANEKPKFEKGNWLLIHGNDWVAKRRLAMTVAVSLYGSVDKLVHINLEKAKEDSSSCVETFTKTMKEERTGVVLIEEIDHADDDFIKLLAQIVDQHKLNDSTAVEDRVFIVTSGRCSSAGDQKLDKTFNSVLKMELCIEQESEASSESSTKRKADWESSPNKIKHSKINDEAEEAPPIRSPTALDLNITAEVEFEESNADPQNHLQEFLQSIKHRLALDINPTEFHIFQASLKTKMEAAAKEVLGAELQFKMNDNVLKELSKGSAQFLGSHFDKWLKEVFQTSLQAIKDGSKYWKEAGVVRISSKWDEKEHINAGFLSSSLPIKIGTCM